MLLADLALRLFDETRLDKVLIKGKGLLDVQLLHDNEGDAIREGVILVPMALEIRSPFVE
jgi:hypothetical protein